MCSARSESSAIVGYNIFRTAVSILFLGLDICAEHLSAKRHLHIRRVAATAKVTAQTEIFSTFMVIKISRAFNAAVTHYSLYSGPLESLEAALFGLTRATIVTSKPLSGKQREKTGNPVRSKPHKTETVFSTSERMSYDS